MKNIKLLALSTIFMMTSTVMASNKMEITKNFCFNQDILSTSGYSFDKSSDRTIKMCINDVYSNEKYEITENSFVYGDNKYIISGFEDKDFNNVESISNLNGKLIIKTKSKKIYTGDIGYVLSNKGYLPLKNNNEIKLIKEDISNVDKVIYSGELIVFTQDKKVFMKSKNNWEQLPLINVIDVTQSRFGSYFIITKDGVFAKMQESDNRTSDPRERGVFYRFDKANLATIPVKSLKFRFVENHTDSSFRLVMDNQQNKRETYYVYFSVNKALITKEGKVNRPEKGLQQSTLEEGAIVAEGIRTEATDVSIEKSDKNIFGSFYVAYLNDNVLSTKYSGNVDLDYKEKLGLLSHPLNKGKVSNFSNIVKILENDKKTEVYILRDNGLLQVFNKNNYLLQKQLKNIKNIITEYDGEIEIIK